MTKGHCLCGAVRWQTDGSQKWAAFCHCESCRRNCAAPVAAFFGVADGHYDWAGDAPAIYHHSPDTTRFFCKNCGTPMAYRADRFPNEIHFYAASMEQPQNFVPTFHVHHA